MTVRESKQSGHLDFGLLLSLVLPLIPIIILATVLVGIAIDVILRDWMLPHRIALEDAGAGEAWSKVWARIMAEKKQFIAYALLRLVLPTIAMIGVFIVLLIPGLILGGSLAVVELGLHSTFADATGGSAVTGLLVQAFFGVLAFGFMVLAGICVGGPVSTAIREYARCCSTAAVTRRWETHFIRRLCSRPRRAHGSLSDRCLSSPAFPGPIGRCAIGEWLCGRLRQALSLADESLFRFRSRLARPQAYVRLSLQKLQG